MNKRIACLLIPDFPLAVQLKEQPELYGKPEVLVENETTRSKVLYTNIQAAEEGISPGMTLVQAKNVCPTLGILISDIKKEQQRSEELLRQLRRFTPFIEEENPGIVYLDVSGLRRIYPQEENLAEELISLIKALGYPVKVGIAGNKFTSLAAASTSRIYTYTISPVGKESEFLKEKPVHLLPVDQDLVEKFCQLGIKTLGQFSLLPDNQIAERFGSEGSKLLKLAGGEDDDQLKPKRFDEKEIQTRDLDYPLETLVGVLFYVNSILEKLLNELGKKGLVCEEILVVLKTDDRKEITIILSLAQGTNDLKTFINLLRLELEKMTLSAPVKEIQVSIHRTSPLISEQLTLYHKKEINLIARIFAQLKRILGNGNILSPQIVSSHRPEGKFKLVSYFPYGKSNIKPETKKEKMDNKDLAIPSESLFSFSQNSMLGLRLYDPPKPATVRIENRLIRYIIANTWYGEPVKQIGPWEISGEWWNEGFDRHYYEIELSEGEQYLIFYESSSKNWYVQGIFD